MFTTGEQAIIDRYKAEVAEVMQNNRRIMAAFVEKFQRPFQARKIIVPGLPDGGIFWQMVGGELDGWHVEHNNSDVLFRYDFSHTSHIISDEMDIYPHANKYAFPLRDYYISRSDYGDLVVNVVYFSPAFPREEVAQFFTRLGRLPDAPDAPNGVGHSGWYEALGDDMPF